MVCKARTATVVYEAEVLTHCRGAIYADEMYFDRDGERGDGEAV